MKIPLNELQGASGEFRTAGREMFSVFERLDKVMKGLEESWEDAGKQVFYQYYQEWHDHAISVSQLLSLAANELEAMVERYSLADGNEPPEPKDIR